MGRITYPEPPSHIDVWWVVVDEPVTAISTASGDETACVWGVLYGMRADRVATKHDMGEVTMTLLKIAQDAFVVQEPSMKCFMRVMRANGLHGLYRKAGTDKTYKF